MDKINTCPVCSNKNFEKFLETKDYFLTGEEFNIEECVFCGFKLTNPRPNEKDLEKYYESQEYISHSNVKTGLIPKIYQRVRKISVKKKANLITESQKQGTFLDIGCGTGELLYEVKNRRWDVVGMEPNGNARRFAQNTYKLNVCNEPELGLFAVNSFDVISLWHVLEHVFDLNEKIAQIKNLLKEDGRLIIALPNTDSFDAKIYGKFWAAYDVPRHLYHFNKNVIEKLFANYNFKIVETKPMAFDSFYVSMLSEKYRTGTNNLIRAFFNGFFSNISGAIKGNNYSSTIYVLKSNID